MLHTHVQYFTQNTILHTKVPVEQERVCACHQYVRGKGTRQGKSERQSGCAGLEKAAARYNLHYRFCCLRLQRLLERETRNSKLPDPSYESTVRISRTLPVSSRTLPDFCRTLPDFCRSLSGRQPRVCGGGARVRSAGARNSQRAGRPTWARPDFRLQQPDSRLEQPDSPGLHLPMTDSEQRLFQPPSSQEHPHPVQHPPGRLNLLPDFQGAPPDSQGPPDSHAPFGAGVCRAGEVPAPAHRSWRPANDMDKGNINAGQASLASAPRGAIII
ncbi:hypothetical protein T492DRAFT_833765 [Pavlovales sp. CCMP2436]|nr:hypothetical protein T492DRAFT_833765 [Pavlovales sp. CCMP2436]